jgi:16S rRNA G966 N2-methylase RsmD
MNENTALQLTKSNINLPATVQELNTFILIGKEKLNAHKAKIRAIEKSGMALIAKEAALIDAQDMADVLLDAEIKMGEILEAIPANIESSGRGTIEKKTSLPPNVTKKQSHQAQTIAKNKEIVEKVKLEARKQGVLPTASSVYTLIKSKSKTERIEAEKTKRENTISHMDIRKGNFVDVLSDVYNIDAIITDPPYPKEYLDCFSDLSKYASEHLKDEGFCCVYSGQYNLPEVIKRLSEHLTYVWTFCLYHVGQKQLVNGVNIMCGWKPVLIFSKGRKKMRFAAYDVLISESIEKHSHEWQQSESGVSNLIEIFTEPGQLVVDPFSGSGTFVKVAVDMKRNGIGAEIK